MKRGRRLLLVSHCVLNQNSVVHPLARAPGALVEVVRQTVEAGAGLVQLPCPEMAYAGLGRPPASLAEYDTDGLRHLCTELADRVEADLAPLLRDGCRVLGVVGIAGSPSCAVDDPKGVWMRELLGRPSLQGVHKVAVPEGCCSVEGAGDQSAFADFWRALRDAVYLTEL